MVKWQFLSFCWSKLEQLTYFKQIVQSHRTTSILAVFILTYKPCHTHIYTRPTSLSIQAKFTMLPPPHWWDWISHAFPKTQRKQNTVQRLTKRCPRARILVPDQLRRQPQAGTATHIPQGLDKIPSTITRDCIKKTFYAKHIPTGCQYLMARVNTYCTQARLIHKVTKRFLPSLSLPSYLNKHVYMYASRQSPWSHLNK